MSDGAKDTMLAGPLRLSGRVQEYAWGKVGRDSRISPFLPAYRPDARLAEYWVGSHARSPSEIEFADGTSCALDMALAQFPTELLGVEGVQRFGQEIPFLVKVLSVNAEYGLSIQAHPDQERARLLHARSPEHYPDSHHKPEIGIALTPVSLLYGCKSLSRIRELLADLPILRVVVGPDVTARIEKGAGDDVTGVGLVKEAFSRSLTLSNEKTSEFVGVLKGQLSRVERLQEESAVFNRLALRYGHSDQGLLTMLFMNMITVPPGQGIFIAPNVPHAYLAGDLVECMACSDNVVRAGLTQKFKDIETLIEMIDCVPSLAGVISPRPLSQGFFRFDTPASEFSVQVLPVGSGRATILSGRGPGVVLCLGAGASIKGSRTGRELVLSDGGAAFLPPDSGNYEVVTTEAAIYHVSTALA